MSSIISPQTDIPRASRLAAALFPETKQRVLGFLFGQPERSFYAKELIKLVGSGSGVVQRELARLQDADLITVQAVGNQKHYRANARSPIFEELCAVIRKTVGIAQPLQLALQPLADHIAAAFVFGSIAKQQEAASSDIDLMLISDSLSYADVFGALEPAQTQAGRTINPVILNKQELARRIAQHEAFIERVLEQPKIWILGGPDDLAV